MRLYPKDEGTHRLFISFTNPPVLFHTDEKREATHVLSVALRQRQIPSRLRKFLCLKPGSSLSQTYWTRWKEGDKRGVWGGEQV